MDSFGESRSAITADGNSVVFLSNASNLVAWDVNDYRDVFVKDLVSGGTQKVSSASDQRDADGMSFAPSVSGDGRLVSFFSEATNLVPEDTNEPFDVFLRVLSDGSVTRVSVSDSGDEANGNYYRPAISHDGRYVTFESVASNLLGSDTNDSRDIFVRDMQTGGLQLASTLWSSTAINNQSCLSGQRYPYNGCSFYPSVG